MPTLLWAFPLLLGVLITVHELGHFLVAKACGVRVLQFSIGFGPRLLGFTRGDTEYRIGILPLGGYVRMYGDDPTQEVPPEERRRSFLDQPYFKQIAISVAGPLANLILPVALFFAMNVGTRTETLPVVGNALAGEPAEAAGLAPGDRIVAVDGTPISYFPELVDYVEPRGGVAIRMTVEKNGKRRDVVVTPRAVPAPTIFDRDKKVGRIGVGPYREMPVVGVVEGSVAANAGLKDGDRVEKIDGEPVTTKAELFRLLDLAAAKGTASVDVVREISKAKDAKANDAKEEKDAKPIEQKLSVALVNAVPPSSQEPRIERFGVTADELAPGPLADVVARTTVAVREQQRDAARRFGLFSLDGRVAHVEAETVAADRGLVKDKHVFVAVDGKALRTTSELSAALDATPDAIHAVGVVGVGGPRVIVFRMLPHPERALSGMKVFGVAISSELGPGATEKRTVGPAEALRDAVRATGDLVVDVLRGFGLIFSGQVGLESLGGPITIAKMSGQAADVGASMFVQLMALISVNLAIINLLPVPVLDGGHIMIFTIEAITRRKMSLETRMKITKVGIALVGLLMLVAIGNDVLGLF